MTSVQGTEGALYKDALILHFAAEELLAVRVSGRVSFTQ